MKNKCKNLLCSRKACVMFLGSKLIKYFTEEEWKVLSQSIIL